MAPPKDSSKSGKSEDQSDSMGRSDDEEEEEEEEEIIPMKQPAVNGLVDGENDNDNEAAADADESFLDDDFLSFRNADNGGDGSFKNNGGGSNSNNGNKLSGRKRERSPSPMPPRNNNGNGNGQYNNNNNNNNYNNYPGQGYQAIKSKVPWMIINDNNNSYSTTTTPQINQRFTPPSHQQQQQQPQQNWGRNRGYGNNNNINNNQQQQHQHQQRYSPPPSVRIPPLIKLHNEIVSFTKLMEPTPSELKIRDKMVERVTKLAWQVFGKDKCQVLPFGSQMTGLCLPGSDIDFVIRIPEVKTSEETSKQKSSDHGDGEEEDEEEDFTTTATSNPLHRFADAVLDEFGVRSELEAEDGDDETTNEDNANNSTSDAEDDGEEDEKNEHLSYLEVIEQTRVPLVKFTVAPYNIDIDICFDQPNGPESAELMHRFMESMPPLRPLTFVLKYFLASREINKPFTGGIGSYLLQLMIVSFLQHRAREDNMKGLLREGQHFNLGSLLLDFLELYGMDFNYVTTGISVRHDGYYFGKGENDKKDIFWQPTKLQSIAMENPLDPLADVGGGAFRIGSIKRIFEHAFKVLLPYVSEPVEPTESILAMIIPPTEEMEKRMMMKQGIDCDDGTGDDDDEDDDEEENVEADDDNQSALATARGSNNGSAKQLKKERKFAKKQEKKRKKDEKKQRKQEKRDEKKQGKNQKRKEKRRSK